MYETLIEPLYGIKRDLATDEALLSSNTLPHMYCINDERVDMTIHETYSIDPDGCQDADENVDGTDHHGRQGLHRYR